ARHQHEQIGAVEGFQSGDIIMPLGIDRAGVRIDREEHGAIEAVTLGENARELRERLFGAVFVVAADEYDVLSSAGSGLTRQFQTVLRVAKGGENENEAEKAWYLRSPLIRLRTHTPEAYCLVVSLSMIAPKRR